MYDLNLYMKLTTPCTDIHYVQAFSILRAIYPPGFYLIFVLCAHGHPPIVREELKEPIVTESEVVE